MRKKKEKKVKKKSLFRRVFAKFFGFEENIDLTNETLVLKRRNIVIKNIIFSINILLFIMMLIYSTFTSYIQLFNGMAHKVLNWAITVSTFPMTFVINFFLKKLIKKGKEDDIQSQRIAMYFALSYLVILVIIFYLKINLVKPENFNKDVIGIQYHRFAEVFSYLLFYLVVGVCALYQDKNVLFNMLLVIFAVLTLMHFFVSHDILGITKSGNRNEIVASLIDILLRSFVFITFSIIIYSTTNISVRLQTERRKELIKRKEAEGDFKMISEIIFDLVETSPEHLFSKKDTENVFVLAKHLSSLIGLSIDSQKELEEYNKKHLNYLELKVETTNNYDNVKEKTLLASEILRRIQLGQKVENIIRSYTERRITQSFIRKQNEQNLNDISNVILISEIYFRLRSPQDYKMPIRHIDAVRIMRNDLRDFFDDGFLITFLQFEKDFEKIYLDLR